MELIVTEKPSQAKDFAVALGARWDKDANYYAAPNYRIVNLRGHLLRLKGLKELRPEFNSSWNIESVKLLPVLPDLKNTSYYDERDKKLVAQLRKHFGSSDVMGIINACDPGREGELLFWELYEYFHTKKPVLRFWESEALSPEVVTRGLANLKSPTFYEPRKRAAYARQHADWLMGMNLTVAYSGATGSFYSVGPVQTPTLAMVVQRDALIELWQPIPYAELHADFKQGFTAKYKPDYPKYEDLPYSLSEDDAPQHVAAFSEVTQGTVTDMDVAQKKVQPPKLYSLTTLQRAVNKKYGFSASNTLKIAQKLYETYKCLSYPRTESEVIGESMVGEVAVISTKLAEHYKVPFREPVFTKRNTNNEKLTDHHALLPLKPLPEEASESERKVYDLVLYRFFEAFGREGIDRTGTFVFDIAGHPFESKARMVLESGWRGIQNQPAPDGEDETNIPVLFTMVRGQTLYLSKPAYLVHKTVNPPARFTEDTLLGAMANVANSLSDQELKKAMKAVDGRLATPATQANIIDLLLERGYIEKRKKQLISTPQGRALIQLVTPELRNAVQRAQMEKLLNDFSDSSAIDTYLQDVTNLIEKCVGQCLELTPADVPQPTIGIRCPKCSESLADRGKFYGCTNCDFTLPKTFAGRVLNDTDLSDLVTTGQTEIHDFKNREGKPYKARVVLSEKRLSLAWPKDDDMTIGTCPKCSKGNVVPRAKVYRCNSCDYVLWPTVAHKRLTENQLRTLLNKRALPVVKGLKKSTGDTFAAGLYLDEQGAIKFKSS